MEEFEKLHQSLDNLTTSSVVSETILGQIFDQNIKIETLIHKKNSEEFKLSDFKGHLKKLKESVDRVSLLRSNMDLILKKVDAIKPPEDVVTNTHIIELLGSMKNETNVNKPIDEKLYGGKFINWRDCFEKNHNRIIIGFWIFISTFLAFYYLPNYFLEKQKLDEDYQMLKVFAESHKLREFYKQGNTDGYDKEISAIRNKEESYVMNYNKIKDHWDKEYEKSELAKTIKEQQEKLKLLQK